MIARLLEWAYAAYAAVVMGSVALAFLPFVLLLPTLAARRNAGRLAVRLAMRLAFVPVRVRGLQHLPAGPCIVVSNHCSYLDGPLLTAALPQRFTFVVQHGAATWPVAGRIIRRMGVTFVDRTSARAGASQTRALIRRVEDGESLVVFPEGTFEDVPGLLSFRRGAFLMAVHANVPVVPAVIRGSRRLLGGGRLRLRHSAIDIELFPPLRNGHDHRAAVDHLLAEARARILAHCGEPDRTGRHG